METEEIKNLLGAGIILSVVIAMPSILNQSWTSISQAAYYALIILVVSVGAKKLVAASLDIRAEHRIWHMERFGFRPTAYFKNEVPTGIILPLVTSLITAGKLFLMTILTFEARALRHRAAKRHGFYSFSEVTDWHNGLIGTSGVIASLFLAVASYFFNEEPLAKFATFYAITSLIPFSNLDGTQILFGSKTIWTVLVAITVIFFLYTLLLV
ncbi:hypothetical protein FJZ18_01905 [Candidatus Pacearchaeota archaeon]|nr:hypothetical protein [Candidatus Pacearchaeota archaeon]